MGKNKYLVLFFTQYGAISYKKLLAKHGYPSITKPVPRALSSSCGISVEAELSPDVDILNLVTEDVEYIYRVHSGVSGPEYVRLYESE